MSSPPVQLDFAVEFASFLVAAAGFALVLLRADLLGRSSREGSPPLALGFAGLAAVAFLHGSLLVPDATAPAVIGIRAAGLALLLAGSIGGSRAEPWSPSPREDGAAPEARVAPVGRRLLWLGVGLQGAAVAVSLGAPVVAAALLGAGAVSIGAALAVSSRRSVAGRVAASAGGTLLALILVLSIALSAVLSSTVQDEAFRSLGSEASNVANQVGIYARSQATSAILLSALVESPVSAPRCLTSPAACVEYLALLSFPGVAVLWVTPAGVTIGDTVQNTKVGLDGAEATALAAMPVVRQVLAGQPSVFAVAKVLDHLFAVGVAAPPAGSSAPSGVVVVAAPLDDSYLGQEVQGNSAAVSLALVDSGAVVAHAGPTPGASQLAPLVSGALAGRPGVHQVVGTHFVSVQPVVLNPHPTLAVIATTSTATIDQTRDSLFRTLFLIALGGTLLALLLAAAVGDSVGAGLRRLTVAADAIRRGQRGVRAGLGTGDEVGVLGSAFDSMATSIDDKTAALAEAAADESRLRNRLEAVVAGMGEALVAVDAEGRVTDFNQAAEVLTGIRAPAAMGEPLDEIVALVGEDGVDLSSQLRRLPGQRWSMQAWIRQASPPGAVDGRQAGLAIPVAVSAGEVRGPGQESAGGVFVFRDLRREREVERMKSELLSRVGHELRTPLTGIMGFTDLLTRAEVAPEQARAWHGEILGQSKRLLRTVEMLEFFASDAAGGIRLRRERLDPRPLVDEVAHRWSQRVDGSHTVARRVAQGVPPMIADRRWLDLALDALMDNAVKFSPDGGRITVRVDPGPDARTVEISVSDQGVGMSEEEIRQVFADFVQVDSSDTRRYGGLGLGLSLVQRVAELHGGYVACQSKPGRGSRFAVVVPVPAEPAS